QLTHERGQRCGPLRRRADRDRDVLALDIAVVAQLLGEGVKVTAPLGRFRRGPQPANAGRFHRRLRMDAARRREDANGERDDEYRRFHRITSSAWIRTDAGTVMPRAWAVLRLMPSSNFIGCSTGRSAGFMAL